MSLSEHNGLDNLTATLDSKIGDGIGVITKGSSLTNGIVAGVENNILTLVRIQTIVQGGSRTAAVAFIPLVDIATILDDLDPTQFNVQ